MAYVELREEGSLKSRIDYHFGRSDMVIPKLLLFRALTMHGKRTLQRTNIALSCRSQLLFTWCNYFQEVAVGSLVVRASDSRPEVLGSMLDVTKYPPSAHGFTCRNCGGGDRGRVAIYRPFGEVFLSLNRTVTCMVLKANDRRTSCPCHDEFRGPRSDYVRQVALVTTTSKKCLSVNLIGLG
ncbi:uncharacterized protein TNCV_2000891 [Trichonephila clavipes]|nr:uncharacterized protein TNCV_2000891 [Trichonephila clavipes]